MEILQHESYPRKTEQTAQTQQVVRLHWFTPEVMRKTAFENVHIWRRREKETKERTNVLINGSVIAGNHWRSLLGLKVTRKNRLFGQTLFY